MVDREATGACIQLHLIPLPSCLPPPAPPLVRIVSSLAMNDIRQVFAYVCCSLCEKHHRLQPFFDSCTRRIFAGVSSSSTGGSMFYTARKVPQEQAIDDAFMARHSTQAKPRQPDRTSSMKLAPVSEGPGERRGEENVAT